MELRHLRYFTVVAEELNFRGAARRLHVTAPALSKQVRDLEEELGVKLFDRNTVSTRLTDAGMVYLAEVRKILALTETATERAREAAAGRRGRLTIGSGGALAPMFLPSAMKAFRAIHPDVEINFSESVNLEQITALENREVQVAFAVSSVLKTAPHLSRMQVLRSPFGVAVGRAHPFARRKTVAVGELSDVPLLYFGTEAASAHREEVERLLVLNGARPGRVRYSQRFDSMVAMVVGEHVLSVIPTVFKNYLPGELVIVPFARMNPMVDFKLWAVWRAEETSQLVLAFLNVLKAHRKSLTPIDDPPALSK